MLRKLPLLTIITVLVVGLFVAACGGEEAEPTPTRAIPTMPVARFAQPTTAITPGAAASGGAAGEESADVTRGRTIYQNKECGSCHGAQGEGVEGKGKAIAGLDMPYDEFEDLMRTGGQGELGPDHLYGPTAISPSGMEALYAYIQQLAP